MNERIEKRIQRITCSLTPMECVIQEIRRRRQFPSPADHVHSVLDPNSEANEWQWRATLNEALKAATRGLKPKQTQQATLTAFQQVAFHVQLAARVAVFVEDYVSDSLFSAPALGYALRNLVRNFREATSAGMTLYPLDSATAAALEAAMRYRVSSTEQGHDLRDELDNWIVRKLSAADHTRCPPFHQTVIPDEKKYRSRDPNVRLRACHSQIRPLFCSDADFAAYLDGRDFNHGFADVSDQEYQSHVETLCNAIHDLIEDGTLVRSALVFIPEVPMASLQYVPLVESEFIDAHVLTLAETTVYMQEAGMDLTPRVGPNIEWYGYHSSSDGTAETAGEGLFLEMQAKAQAHLSRFPGQKEVIDGRPYLHFRDYAAWKGRNLRELDPPEEGILVESWNRWCEQNTSQESLPRPPILAGYEVGKIPPLVNRSGYVVYDNPTEAAARRPSQKDTAGSGSHTLTNLSFDTPGFVDLHRRLRDWVAETLSLLEEGSSLRIGVDYIQNRYFRGEPILYPDQETTLKASLRRLEDLLIAYRACILDTRPFPPGPVSGEKDPALITADDVLGATRPAVSSWLFPVIKEAKDEASMLELVEDAGLAS